MQYKSTKIFFVFFFFSVLSLSQADKRRGEGKPSPRKFRAFTPFLNDFPPQFSDLRLARLFQACFGILLKLRRAFSFKKNKHENSMPTVSNNRVCLWKGYEKDTKLKADELGQKRMSFYQSGFNFNYSAETLSLFGYSLLSPICVMSSYCLVYVSNTQTESWISVGLYGWW